MSRLAIVGAGYVGLVTGACLADRGHPVILADLSTERVRSINGAAAPFFEPGLDQILKRVVGRRLTATTDLGEAMAGAGSVMLAVGTPTTGGSIDLDQLRASIESVAGFLPRMEGYPVVIVKSTVVPGTTDRVVVPLLEAVTGLVAGRDFGVAVNPEFLTEGTAVEDFSRPDRIVIGASDERSHRAVAALYEGFEAPIIAVTPATAEMIKYASNTLLATLISFSNEIANLGAAIGDIDIVDVMRGVHTSRYLTTPTPQGPVSAPITSFLEAGSGYGGSCLPKDTEALAAWGERLGVPMRVLRAVDEVNRHQPGQIIRLLDENLGDLSGRRIGILGLAFKPDTDDVRESPAFPIIRSLAGQGARVVAHDPAAIPAARQVLADVPGVEFVPDLADLVKRVDALVLVTRWHEYLGLSKLLAGVDPVPLVVDGRRVLDPAAFARYVGIGR